jgi:hypothetical protein
MDKVKNVLNRVAGGLLMVFSLGALMAGGLLAFALITESPGVFFKVAFGALFTTAFVLGAVKGE